MIPIPSELQRLYPRVCAIPERPWWTVVAHDQFWRADGALARSTDEAAAVDEVRPLPRPPYRAGQVWAWADPDLDVWIVMTILMLSLPDEGGADIHPQRPPDTAFLLFDVCPPHFTPWSPATSA